MRSVGELQVSGSLLVSGSDSQILGNVDITGVVSASSFSGDGSGLSGLSYYTDDDNQAYLSSIGVISSSTQIASDISGAFTSISESLVARTSTLEEFSSSLDTSFATDSELINLSTSLASDINTNDVRLTTLEGKTLISSSDQITITEAQISDLTHYTDSDTLDYLNILGIVSGSSQISYTGITDIPNGIVSSSAQLSDTTIPGSLTVGGILTAQEFHTEFVSASIIYQSGSTKFGDSLDDIHNFSGSLAVNTNNLFVSGGKVGIGTNSPQTALDVNGIIKVAGNGGGYVEGYRIIWETPDAHRNIGANAFQIENVTSQGLTFGGSSNQFAVLNTSGNLGIGTTTPAYKLDVNGIGRFSGELRVNNTITAEQSTAETTSIVATSGWSSTANNPIITFGRLGLAVAGQIGYDDTNTRLYIGTTTNHNLAIRTNNSDRLTITNSGAATFSSSVTGNSFIPNSSTIPTNGIYLPTTNTLGFSTNGSERMRIDASGNVNLSNNTNYILLGTSVSTNPYLQGDANNSLYIGTLNLPRLTVNYTGNVGIGTTSPNTKLDVSGSISLAGTDGLRIGSVGDNSAYDNVKLYYTGYNGGAPRVYMTPRTTPGSGVVNTFFHLQNTNGISMISNNTMGLIVDGNVGIGTTSPNANLDVNGTGRFSNTLTASSTAGGTSAIFQNTGAQNSNGIELRGGTAGTSVNWKIEKDNTVGNAFQITPSTTNGGTTYTTPSLTIASTGAATFSGNVGIGTTDPTSRLQSNNSSTYNSSTPSGAIIASNLSNNNAIIDIGVDATYLGYIQSRNIANTTAYNLLLNPGGGNVGIGTTTPDEKLDVDGNIKSSGSLTLGTPLSVANGGTGATSFTAGRVLFGNGTSAINTDGDLFWDNSNKILNINNSSISSGPQSLNVYGFDGAANFFTTRGEEPFNNTISLYNNPSSGQGYGTGILFRAKSDDTNSRVQAAIYSSWTTATDASRTAKLVFRTTENGAAADKLTILGNGNVGIGTTSPFALLHVSQPSANTTFRLGNNSTYDQFMYFNGANDWSLGMDYSNSNAFVLSNASTIGTNDRVVVTTEGNVGIGVTPSAWYIPSVWKAMQINNLGLFSNSFNDARIMSNAYLNTSGSYIYIASSTATKYYQQSGSHIWYTAPSGTAGDAISFTQAMTLDANGRLGIGTTSPAQRLNVKGSAGNGIALTHSNNTVIAELIEFSGVQGAGLLLKNSSGTTNVLFNAGGDSYFNGGNLGIGTNSPSATLHLSNATPYIYLDDISTSGTRNRFQILNGDVGTTQTVTFGFNNTSGTNLQEVIAFNENGNVGIGTTTPQNKLDVEGGAVIGATYSGTNTAPTNGLLVEGNVGIGTTTDAGYKLDVNGDVRILTSAFNGLFLEATSGPETPNLIFKSTTNRQALDNSLGSLRFFREDIDGTGGTVIMVLTDSLNVGIGTTSPTTKLNLKESNTGTEGFIITNWNNVNTLLLGSDSTTGGGKLTLQTNSGTSNVFISSYSNSYFNGGNVGIGTTSPSYKLHVNGSVAGVGAYNNLSDVNYKKNINDLELGLDIVKQLRPITYNWINEEYGTRTNIGFIAQEVESVLPNIVTTADDNVKSMATTDLIPILTKAIQEQQTIIETQEQKIQELETLLQTLVSKIETLENK